MRPFEYHAPTKLLFEREGRKKVGEICAQYGRRVMLVTGKGSMKSLGFLDEMVDICEQAGCEVVLFSGVEPNPSCTTVDKGADLVRSEGIEVILALGGGSTMDASKVIGLAGKYGGLAWEYMNKEREVPGPILPLIAVTSTSGTGSHVTQFAVILNPETFEKPGLGSEQLFPRVSVVDVDILMHQPTMVTAYTGVDVLTHAMESLFSKFRSPFSEACAWEAIRLVGRHLREAVSHGDDLEARNQMSIADTYAGWAISNGGVTIGHALAHPVSGRFPEIAHGHALACVHVPFLSFMQGQCGETCEQIALSISPGERDASKAFQNLLTDIGVDPSLRRAGSEPIGEEMIASLVENALSSMAVPIQRSEAEADKATLARLYKEAL